MIAFIGKRAVGYMTGVGVAVETIAIAGWAINWITSPAQDEKMKERAKLFMEIFESVQ